MFVDNLFRSLAGNPAITKVQILVEEKGTGNDYRIIDQDKNELNPILSQGDFNCLALALFFGLAEAAVEARPFSVVLFDDPSQSLGTQNKRQFVDALDRATDGKSMLISTTDHELRDLLEKGIAKDKRVYTFADWHPDRGPKISQGG